MIEKTKGRKPDFLIIGAMKCGTTSLHNYLGLHPDIFTTTPKEVHYFIDPHYQNQSLNWYLQHFATSKKIAGASPQNYTKRHRKDFDKVPPRLHQQLPNVKLIYILRDPIKRIYSHYSEAQEGGYAPPEGLNNYLKDFRHNHYVLTSCYYYQLQTYLEYFSKDQIHVLTLEKLRDDRLNTLNGVFHFLDVPQLKDDFLFDFQSNARTSKTRASIFGKILYSDTLSPFRASIPRRFKDTINSQSWFTRLNRTRRLKRERIEPDLEADIKAFLKEDIDQLRNFCDYSFEEWSI